MIPARAKAESLARLVASEDAGAAEAEGAALEAEADSSLEVSAPAGAIVTSEEVKLEDAEQLKLGRVAEAVKVMSAHWYLCEALKRYITRHSELTRSRRRY